MMQREWQRGCEELQGLEPAPADKYNLLVPRSACPVCTHQITAWQNIPLLSYVLLRGKCANCQTGISPRYPLVELLTGTLTGLISWYFGYSAMAVLAWLFSFALIAL